MTPGDLAIKIAALFAVMAFVTAISWARGREGAKSAFLLAYHGLAGTLLFASALLMIAILNHDFRFEYVINYSSRDLPLLYLISAFWAGQEGTYLIWALFAALIGYALLRKRSWEPASVMIAYVPTIGFLLALMLHPAGNPFRLSETVPPDGHGLNLLLQDPWMACHPPVIFLGYAAVTVPAVLALVTVFKKKEDVWLDPALRWGLIGFVSLGIGIILGGFWAYKVLGWGGYWGWDPVENASLLPWLAVTALVHGLLVQRSASALRRTNLALALIGYVLVLYATFLTRSGVLSEVSVHSFAAGSIYDVLLGILIIAVVVSAVALVLRARLRSEPLQMNLSWPFVLTMAVVFLSVAALFVLIGTSSPIFSRWVPRPDFYNRANLPLVAILLALLCVAPFLAWRRLPWNAWRLRVVPSLAIGLIGTAVAFGFGARGAGAGILFFAALAALTSNVIRFAEVARVRPLNTGASIAHIGFALMFVGIVTSSAWERSTKASLPLGRPVEVLDRILTFRGHVDGSEPRDRWRLAVQKPGEPETYTQVSMFVIGGGGNNSVMKKPAIVRGIAGDLYIAPTGLEITGRGTRNLDLTRGEPVSYGDATMTFLEFRTDGTGEGHQMTVRAVLEVKHGDSSETVSLPMSVVNGRLAAEPVDLESMPGVRLTLDRMSVEQGRILVSAEDGTSTSTQVLTAEVHTKPFIWVLWTGTVLLSVGCILAVVRRYRDERLVPGTLGSHKEVAPHSLSVSRQETFQGVADP